MKKSVFGRVVTAAGACALLAAMAPAVLAVPIVFDLSNNAVLEPLDENQTFPLTVSGLTATLGSYEDGVASGVLNSTASTFGVNGVGGLDETSQLDGDNGTIESIRVSFNGPVRLESFTVSGFAGADAGTMTIAGGSPFAFSANGTFILGGGIDLGQYFEIAYTGSATGFSFDGFSVSVIPEPSTIVLACAGLVALGLGRGSRRRTA